MTSFAGHAQHQIVFVKPIANVRRSRMTSEAAGDLSHVHRTIHCLLQVLGGSQSAGRSEVNRTQRFEVGNSRFVELSVILLEQVGLTLITDTKCPEKSCGQRM